MYPVYRFSFYLVSRSISIYSLSFYSFVVSQAFRQARIQSFLSIRLSVLSFDYSYSQLLVQISYLACHSSPISLSYRSPPTARIRLSHTIAHYYTFHHQLSASDTIPHRTTDTISHEHLGLPTQRGVSSFPPTVCCPFLLAIQLHEAELMDHN